MPSEIVSHSDQSQAHPDSIPDDRPPLKPLRGLTVADLARRYRVGEDKIRGWIKRGELRALNTAGVRCGKPRYVVTPEALEAFERGRQAAAPKPAPRRKRRATTIDFYPD
jgi:hypothetical protein